MSRIIRVLAAWLAVVVLLSGCSSGSKPAGGQPAGGSQPAPSTPKFLVDDYDVTQLYEAAKKEGKLSLYVGAYTLEQTNAYAAEFKKVFPGIEVLVYRAATGVVLERFLSEARAGKFLADVLLQGDPYALRGVIKEGYLLEYDLHSKDKFDQKFIVDKYVYPHSVVYVGPAINTNLVKPDDEARFAKDWKYVTDPKWKGKVAITVPEAGGTAYGPTYMFMGEKRSTFGPDFLKALQPNIGKVFPSTVPATAELAAGEFAVFPHAGTAGVYGPLKDGAPIHIVYPAPTPAIAFSGALVAKGPNPNAAKLFFEWAFSKQGEEKVVQIVGNPSIRKDVTADPFAQYSWYKQPTEIWVVQDVDAYLKGLTTLTDEWHTLMKIPK